MSNLLPYAAQKKIHREYQARFILAGSFLAMAMAVFTLLSLAPSYGVLTVTRPAAIAQAAQGRETKNETADLAQAQLLVTQYLPVSAASSSLSHALLAALSVRPEGVHVDSIVYTAGNTATLTFGGIADNPEQIDRYRSALDDDARFTSVKLPVGDLIAARGGRFTITLNGKF